MNVQILGLEKQGPPFALNYFPVYELILLVYTVTLSIIEYYMIRRSIIAVEFETRQHMKNVARKSQTYDDLINELLKLKEQHLGED